MIQSVNGLESDMPVLLAHEGRLCEQLSTEPVQLDDDWPLRYRRAIMLVLRGQGLLHSCRSYRVGLGGRRSTCLDC
jgi:hypothetical protein